MISPVFSQSEIIIYPPFKKKSEMKKKSLNQRYTRINLTKP